jgi:calcium-dependent protein kinase
MRSLLSAVAYLHQRRVVHRDIKPENIIMGKDNDPSKVKLIDFGAAQQLAEGETMTRQIGTLLYMAPELFYREGYTEKCDMWSCGVVLHVLLTGMPPFFPRSGKDLLDLASRKPVTRSTLSFDAIPESAKDLILKLLTINPRLRISAVDALQHEWFA